MIHLGIRLYFFFYGSTPSVSFFSFKIDSNEFHNKGQVLLRIYDNDSLGTYFGGLFIYLTRDIIVNFHQLQSPLVSYCWQLAPSAPDLIGTVLIKFPVTKVGSGKNTKTRSGLGAIRVVIISARYLSQSIFIYTIIFLP